MQKLKINANKNMDSEWYSFTCATGLRIYTCVILTLSQIMIYQQEDRNSKENANEWKQISRDRAQNIGYAEVW